MKPMPVTARSIAIFLSLLFTSLAASTQVDAQSGVQPPGQVEQPASDQQRSPRAEQAEHHDGSPPLYLLPPAPRLGGQRAHFVKPLPRRLSSGVVGAAVLPSVPTPLAPLTTTNFDGIGEGFVGPAGTFTVNSAPSDSAGDVGPNHYVQIVNESFAVFDKNGTAIFGPVATNTLWSGFGGGCQTNNDGDAVVVYDPIADRWVISQFSVTTTPYLYCVAVSQTPDPTGAYFRYSFQYADFPDYPKVGVWPDAYYVTFNMFNGNTFAGAKVCAYDRARMLAGAAATQQCFDTSNTFGGLLPADLDGARLPPAGSPNYVLGLGPNVTDTTLAFWKFHVDWSNPANSTFTGPTQLTVDAYTEACNGGTCIPQLGLGAQKLDSLADRLMFRLAYRNFGDHESLVVNHSITAGSSVGVRWYEIRSPNTTPTIFQQGTYAPDSNFRWMGSIAMDQSGNVALGFSVSGSTIHPQIHYTGRLASDAAGTMAQGEGTIIDGAGSQTGSSLTRWGDYSMMAVDPSDDCTFWYTNEYIPSNGAFNWKTRIASFRFPSCGPTLNDFSISSSPTGLNLVQGTSGTSTISTAVTSGSAESLSLSVSGVPSGASTTLTPTSVSAGDSATLSVDAGTAAAGTYTLTVTGTGASATHSTPLTLTVTSPPNDFSISANPTSLSLVQGASGASTISTLVTSGVAETVNLSVSGAPSGATATLTPTSVAAGGSSTLSVDAGTAATGTYTLTVTGTGASATHSTPLTLTVTSAPNDFSISASPTSLSLVQGASGTSTISTAVTSGVAETVALSVSGAPSGATATFTPTSIAGGTSSTLSVSAGTAAVGTYTLTVTGTGASATHSTSVTLTVTPRPTDFSISVSPSSLTVGRGSIGVLKVTVTGTNGFAGKVKLSVSGLPARATEIFLPASVTGSGSSFLIIVVGLRQPSGSFPLTVTGTSGALSHSTNATLTVP